MSAAIDRPPLHPPSSTFERLLALLLAGLAAWLFYGFVVSSPATPDRQVQLDVTFEGFETVVHDPSLPTRRRGPSATSSFAKVRDARGQALRLAVETEALSDGYRPWPGQIVQIVTDDERRRLYEMRWRNFSVVKPEAARSALSSRRLIALGIIALMLVFAAVNLRGDILRLSGVRRAGRTAHPSSSPSSQ